MTHEGTECPSRDRSLTHDGLNAGRMTDSTRDAGRMTREPCLDIEKMSMYLYHDVSFHSKLVGNDTS